MTTERIHALLPWYANGTLEPDERELFERHLASCPSCRAELVTVEKMRAEITRHGEAFFADHPAPERLGALFGVGETPLEAAEEADLRHHLSVCATCSEETQWLTGAQVAEGSAPDMGVAAREMAAGRGSGAPPQGRAADASGGWTPWSSGFVSRLWPAAAAAALAVVATVLVPGPWRGPEIGSGPVARGYLRETSRSSAVTEIALSAEQTAVVLDIPSPTWPSSTSASTSSSEPARVEILDDAGRIVHSVERLRPAGQGLSLYTVVVPSAKVRFGNYIARLHVTGEKTEPPVEYPFRLVAGAP